MLISEELTGGPRVVTKATVTLEPETTQQSGQTPDKEAEIKNITVYVSGYTETDTTGMLSPPDCMAFQCSHVKCLEP